MLGTKFYNESIRKYVVAFGTLFNNMWILRRDSSDVTVREIKIPILYTEKQRWYSRLQGDSVIDDDEAKIRMTVPRAAFNITDITYDPERKTNTLQKLVCLGDTLGDVKVTLNRVPYTFTFELYGLFKDIDDGLQFLEQILPYFTPEFNLPIKDIPELEIISSSSLSLVSNTKEIPYEGGKDADIRTVQHTLTFTLQGWLYGPISDQKIIQHSIIQPWIGSMNNNPSALEKITATFQEITFDTTTGDFTPGEILYVGTIKKQTKSGLLLSYDSGTKVATIVSLDIFQVGEIVNGLSSGFNGTVLTFDEGITYG